MTTEILEGVARDVSDEPERRVVAFQPQQSVQVGLGSVMTLTDEQFEANLVLLRKGVDRAKRMQEALLEPGTDFGTVPGISRPFLHKPGAEKFEKAYGLAISYEVERKVGDGDKTPELEYIVHAKVHLGDTDGPVVGEGLGSCNTHESKYRYRQAKPACPDCGKTTVIKGKADGKLKGKWWCATRDGGCGHTFAPDDTRLTEQPVGQVENENPYDLANTILKMARKRAGVDGILTATGTSGLFTQDDDSPAVQRDAAGGGSQPAATAAQGGEAAGEAPLSTTAASRLPAPKSGITEPQSLGNGDVTGKVAIRDNPPSDGQLRQTPDGWQIGFVLEVPSGQKIAQVELRGPVAEQLAERIDGGLEKIVGTEVNVAGELIAVPWKKGDEQMPPFYRLKGTAIKTREWSIDGETPAAAPEAKPKRQTKPKAAAKPVEDEPTDDDAPLEGSLGPIAVPADTRPGISYEDFAAALDTHRISPTFAAQAAKKAVGSDDLKAITPQQRHEVATGLGLYDEP